MIVLGLVIVCALIILTYWLLTHGHFQFQRHQYIESDSNDIYKEIVNLASWPSWCIWRYYNPDADIQLDYFDAHSMSASTLVIESKKLRPTGIKRVSEDEVEQIASFEIESADLYSDAIQIHVHLSQRSHSTLVTLDVEGKMPFLKRYQIQKNLSAIALDLELSLIRLKNRMESSLYHKDEMSFELLGCQKLETLDAVTRPFEAVEKSISETMEIGFNELFTGLGPDNLPNGPCFALYTKADLKAHNFSGKLGIPIQHLSDDCALHPECIRLSGHFLQLRYQGSYKYLYLAWRILNTLAKVNGYAINHTQPALEVYEVGPKDDVEADQFVTILSISIKA